ncbi:hypothetical protein Hanom_Chr12g01066801 [Helianthus anomalus]
MLDLLSSDFHLLEYVYFKMSLNPPSKELECSRFFDFPFKMNVGFISYWLLDVVVISSFEPKHMQYWVGFCFS